MTWLARTIASVGGIGYFPVAPGTAGSMVGLLLGLLISPLTHRWLVLLGLAVGFVVGVVASTKTEQDLGLHDPSVVVIDEVWGMWAVMVAIAPLTRSPLVVAMSFVLFRVFDILKPPPLKWFARFPGGWGIMLDDVGAAVYTGLVLWCLISLAHDV